MHDTVATGDGVAERIHIARIRNPSVGIARRELGVSHHRACFVATRAENAKNMSADEAAGADDGNFHQADNLRNFTWPKLGYAAVTARSSAASRSAMAPRSQLYAWAPVPGTGWRSRIGLNANARCR